jgi:hypothetical protein
MRRVDVMDWLDDVSKRNGSDSGAAFAEVAAALHLGVLYNGSLIVCIRGEQTELVRGDDHGTADSQ